MGLEDPRDPPKYEYLYVKFASTELEADGWKHAYPVDAPRR
jgi:hypothetical protein